VKSFQAISKVFNVENSEPVPDSLPTTVSKSIEQEDDFQLARNTLKNLIMKNDDVINELIYIAKNSEHPRAFEVVGQLMKAQSDITKELMNVHKTKKEIAGEETTNITQNNVIFAGSTSELMKMISASKAKVIDSQ